MINYVDEQYAFKIIILNVNIYVVAEYPSRESILVQQSPEHQNVKHFYDANTTTNTIYNKTRAKYSNAGGINIFKLHLHHLQTSILTRTTNAHHFEQYNPHQVLNNSPVTNNKYKTNMLSPQSQQLLNAFTMD